jgi:hypothetical protein
MNPNQETELRKFVPTMRKLKYHIQKSKLKPNYKNIP